MNPNYAQHAFSRLFIWGTAFGSTSNFIAKGIGAGSSFFVLAALSVYQYGLYQLILSAIDIAYSFTAGLFDDIAVNDIARGLAEGRVGWAKRLFGELFIFKIAIAIAIFLVIFFGAEAIARYYDKDIASYLRLMSVVIIIQTVQAMQSFFFRVTVSFSTMGAGVIQEALRILALTGFWFFGTLGIREVLLSGIFVSAAMTAYASYFFIREYRARFQGIASEGTKLLWGIVRQYGKLVFLRYAVARAGKGREIWFIRIFLNTEAVALYSLAINLIAMIESFFPARMLSTLLPWEAGDRGRFGYIYRRMAKYAFWVGAIAAIMAFIAIPPVIGFLFPKYLPAIPIFISFLSVLPIYGIYKFQKVFLIVLREQKILTARLFTEIILTSAVLATLLPLIGLFAVSVSYFLLYVFRVAFYTFYLKRRYPELRIKFRNIFSFDSDDLKFLKLFLNEVLRPSHWFRLRKRAQET